MINPKFDNGYKAQGGHDDDKKVSNLDSMPKLL